VRAAAVPEPPIDPRPSPAPPVAPTPPPARAAGGAPQEELSLNRLAERWGEVIARVRDDGRGVLAAALEHAIPIGVSGRGEITVELEPGGAIYQQPIAGGAADVLSAVGTLFTGATRLSVSAPAMEALTPDAPPARLTEEGVRGERLALLRRRDPVLDLAVEVLDLELLD
jgi:hypothetical protein